MYLQIKARVNDLVHEGGQTNLFSISSNIFFASQIN